MPGGRERKRKKKVLTCTSATHKYTHFTATCISMEYTGLLFRTEFDTAEQNGMKRTE